MQVRERFLAVLNAQRTIDRLPIIEWATWWDETINNWQKSGIPTDTHELYEYFGIDSMHQFWVSPVGKNLPKPLTHGASIISDESDYEKYFSLLYPEDNLKILAAGLKNIKPLHDNGETIVWFTLEGFFWFPRTLFGIQEHLYSFYDYPELMHKINTDLLSYHKKTIEIIFETLTPEFMTFAEDMSYNHGPMISRELYDEYMLPYYNQLVPQIKANGTKVLIDTDGDVEPIIPWFLDAGIEGVLPLERQAGVDVVRIRNNYPDLIMIGGFDKTIIKEGTAAMMAEFERLMFAMKSGRYIPSVDHQTPPDVSLDNYKEYIRLANIYARHACRHIDIPRNRS